MNSCSNRAVAGDILGCNSVNLQRATRVLDTYRRIQLDNDMGFCRPDHLPKVLGCGAFARFLAGHRFLARQTVPAGYIRLVGFQLLHHRFG